MNAQTLLAAVGLLVCALLLARMTIGRARRDRLDAVLRSAARLLNQGARALWRRRRLHGQAKRETTEAIRRAREGKPEVDREGNVYTPRSFKGGELDEGDTPDGRDRRDH